MSINRRDGYIAVAGMHGFLKVFKLEHDDGEHGWRRRMDGWMEGWMVGWMDGWIGEWMDGWIGGWMGA